MRRCAALLVAICATAASAQGMGGAGLKSGSFSATLIAPGASGSDMSLTADLKFVNGSNTSTNPINNTYNCINFGPSAGGNQWWMCAKPNFLFGVFNNTSQYSGYRLSDGYFTLNNGAEAPIFNATSSFHAYGGATVDTRGNGTTGTSLFCGGNTGDQCSLDNEIGAVAATSAIAAIRLRHNNGALDATDLLLDVQDNLVSKFKVDASGNGALAGSLTTTRELVIDKVSSGIGAGNLLATGTNYSGYKLPQAWTLTHLSINVTTASTATVANTVFTTTDGTNTCTFTFACNTDTNTTGVKDKAGVNGAGTGCVYAAAALVTLSVTTQGCATAVTTNSITTWGKPQ